MTNNTGVLTAESLCNAIIQNCITTKEKSYAVMPNLMIYLINWHDNALTAAKDKEIESLKAQLLFVEQAKDAEITRLRGALDDFIVSYDHCIDKTYREEQKIFGLHFDFSLIDGAAKIARKALSSEVDG